MRWRRTVYIGRFLNPDWPFFQTYKVKNDPERSSFHKLGCPTVEILEHIFFLSSRVRMKTKILQRWNDGIPREYVCCSQPFMWRGNRCSRSILCWSRYLVPFPIYKMLLKSCDEDIKQILFEFCSYAGMAWKLQLFQVFIHFHPCHSRQPGRQQGKQL